MQKDKIRATEKPDRESRGPREMAFLGGFPHAVSTFPESISCNAHAPFVPFFVPEAPFASNSFHQPL